MQPTLEQTAAQLRCPHGEMGRAFGQAMNLRNLSLIVNAFSTLGLNDGDRVLELGYGNGGLLGYVLSLAARLHYTGVETSPLMHEEAAAFNQAFINAGLADYHLYNGAELPFADHAFDKIISINTLYFWEHPAALMEEICRVLKTGGRLCLSFCGKNFMQTLPFCAYGFTLYEPHDVVALTRGLPLRLCFQMARQDKAVDKSGNLTDRVYIEMLFEKTA
ncbi:MULTISPECIES: class I SAM-dependent methyltransferase [unclassified Neisseria]|uniref:class I SAM-dependent methyltransferase n=1 Tax=unclassified Neisseria TaxID=2623750 RepID=UPI0026667A71|nr:MULTISPECIES: class I SAM-dependent methyltransferase [unclassified Neisseria]MDO1509229.1 class I SAM-dependent methyltransferase [Neisseria sp. MVDL19-042950]MDO1515492.1 class I SAM-dependent methyltransferase [Neisseria sp. MVDL18-041461]MDO1562851.1 class I SAM-dependent methyltransferase [Neisseria sp. MVDL20-010259]